MKFPNRRVLLACLCLFGLSASLMAQKSNKITIKKADAGFYTTERGQAVNRLVGHVVFQHEGVYMYCDSAYFYTAQNRIHAFGNIHINQGDTLHMYSDSLKYDGNTRIAEVYSHVELKDQQMQLTTDYLRYNRNTYLASYTDGAVIVNDPNQLSSIKGDYDARLKKFYFKDSVVVTNPAYVLKSDTLWYYSNTGVAWFMGPSTVESDTNLIYCESGWYNTRTDISQLSQNASVKSGTRNLQGDSIYYNRTIGYGKAYGHVRISDTLRNYLITGAFAEYHQDPLRARVTGEPLMSIRTEGRDSLHVHGDTLFISTGENGERVMRTFYNVKIYRSNLQGLCDSLAYNFTDSTIRMFRNPILWSGANQMTADHILLSTAGGLLDSLKMLNNAFIIAEEDSTKYNQIKGKDMYGDFVANELRKVYVEGNGQTIYYAKDEKGTYIGVNKADCSNISIKVKENEIDRITFITKPDAHLYPLGQIPEPEKRLKGFLWRGKERPVSKATLLK